MTGSAQAELATMMVIVGGVGLLITIAVYVWYALALSRLFPRIGGEGWKGWVPVLNEAEILARGGVPAWSVVFYFIPIVQLYGLYLKVVATHRINERFGRGAAMTVLAVLLPPVWATVLAWGTPPYPEGDRLAALQPGPRRSPQPAPPRDASGYAIPSLAPQAPASDAPALVFPDYAPPLAQPSAPAPTVQAPAAPHPAPQFSPAPPPVGVPTSVRPAPPTFQAGASEATPATPVIRPAPTPIVSTPPTIVPPSASVAPPHASADVPTPAPAPPPAPAPAPPPAPAAVPLSPVPATPSPAEGLADEVDKTVISPRRDDDEDLEATVVVARKRGVRRWLVLDDGRRFALSGASVVIGRNPTGEPGEQRLAVSDATRTLSKTHARLVVHEDEWRLTDLHATNGVVVVGEDGVETLLDAGESVMGTGRFILGEVGMHVIAEHDS